MSKSKRFFFLALILIIALFFRFWKLNEIPPGLYPDVAIYGNDALDTLENKHFKVFYPENNGREGFWMWILALFFKIFGVSILTIKITAAICGTLTVVGIYLLVKELFEEERMALLSSFLLSISFWHIIISRIGFRVITYPMLVSFSFYFLIKALKKIKIFYFALAGIFFGLSFYTYTSFRMLVFVLPFLFFPRYFQIKEKKELIFGILLFLLLTFFVALPLGVYFLKNPEHFLARMAPISVFHGKDKLFNFLKSFILHLAMFNFYGDPNLRHNIPNRPYLSIFESILFLIGLFVSIFILLKKEKTWKETVFLLSFLFFSLLPGILTKEGIPHGLRSSGAILPATIFSAQGGIFIGEKIKKYKFSKIFLFVFLTILILINYQKYFIIWAKHPDLKGAFGENFLKMGVYLNSLPESFEKYVIVNVQGVPVPFPNGIPMPAQTLMFLERARFGKIKSNYLLPKDLEKIKIEKEGVVLFMKRDEDLAIKLREKFTDVILKEEGDFSIFEIKNF